MSINKILDTSGTQYVNGLVDPDVSNIFVISSQSSDYSWSKSEDGTGIVVWDNATKEPDILWNIDYIAFSDGYVKANDNGTFSFVNEIDGDTMQDPQGSNKIHDEAGTQYVHGTAGKDDFVINGNSSDYSWSKTEDGTGTVVWNIASGEPDILWDVECIQFNDGVIDLTAQPSSHQDPSGGDDANLIYNEAGTQFINGTTDKDTFVINGKQQEYNWNPTVDGTGTVIWNVATGEHDILWGVECIKFTDNTIELAEAPHYCPPGTGNNSAIGDRVWLDANKNGLQETGEAGVSGVTVQLKDANGAVISTQQTDANGDYLFTNLEAGTYSVGVVAPDGFDFTGQDALNNGIDTLDSDINVTTGMSQNVVLGENETNLTIDAGLVEEPGPKNSLGDYIWLDENKNGIQEAGEAGIGGVSVQLKDQNGMVLENTVTAADGSYQFDNLDDGTYSVGVVAPDGFDFTGQDALNNGIDILDSDIDATTGMSHQVSLAGGENDPTIDGGLVEVEKKCAVEFSVDGLILKEGTSKSVKLNLDKTFDTDTVFKIKVNEISAFLADSDVKFYTGHSLGDREATWYYGKEQDKINALQQGSDHNSLMDPRYNITDAELAQIGVGVATAVQDFHILNAAGNIIDVAADGTFEITVPAGQSMSSNFQVKALYDAHLAGDHAAQQFQEGSESFSLSIMSADGVECVDPHEVSVRIDNTFIRHTPIALDLNGDGEIGVTGETSSHEKDANAEIGQTVEFDIDADGKLDNIEWFDGSGDGILIDNRDGNAATDMDGSRLFGDEGGKYANGYDKLAALDENDDGVLNGEELAGLELWVDDGDAIVEEGEIQTLDDHDIVEISTQMEIHHDKEGRELMQSSAKTSDGEKILSEDVWFAGQGQSINDEVEAIELTVDPALEQQVESA